MSKEEILKKVIILAVILSIPISIMYLKPMIFGHDIEKVRAKMEEGLKDRLGKDFVVDSIGIRRANGDKFYEARVYPKEIIGTSKEGDPYYYKSASMDIEPFGKLGGVVSDYTEVMASSGVEDVLMPKIKELFGDRVLLKSDVVYKEKRGDIFLELLIENFKWIRRYVREDPENNRLELELYIYIFDRIDNDKEKEERRKDIFEFIQYLKKEELFEYLEMGVIFIDERVLAPSYEEYKKVIDYVKTVAVEVEGEKVYLPPMKVRKQMTEVLGEELEKMTEDELIGSMNRIQKSDLTYKETKFDAQYFEWIYSIGMLKENYNTSYQRYKKNNKLENYNYNEISNIEIGQSLEYIYIN